MTPIPDYSPDPTLTPQQHHIISLLAQGQSITQAAEAANLHRNTIANWRRTIPAFARELEHAQREYRQYWQEQATRLLPIALQVIEETLTNPKASPSLRFRAATLLIKMATAPQPAKNPDTLPTELAAMDDQKLEWHKQIAAENENPAQVHNPAQPEPEPNPNTSTSTKTPGSPCSPKINPSPNPSASSRNPDATPNAPAAPT